MIDTGGVFKDKDDWNPRDCLTHDLKTLVKLAGLDGELNARRDESAATRGRFAANWNRVLGWKVTSRYKTRTETEARELFDAITHNPDGVLRWVKKFW